MVTLVVNPPQGSGPRSVGSYIRQAATTHGVAAVTLAGLMFVVGTWTAVAAARARGDVVTLALRDRAHEEHGDMKRILSAMVVLGAAALTWVWATLMDTILVVQELLVRQRSELPIRASGRGKRPHESIRRSCRSERSRS